MNIGKSIAIVLLVATGLGLGLSLANAPVLGGGPEARSWRTEPKHSAGMAPDPQQHAGVAVVQRNYAIPDGLWFGAGPRLLVDHRGDGVEAMIDAIEAVIESYPYAREYRSYPGPNSNTFLAHIGREVPALKLDLPANAIGKDYRPLSSPLGVSPTGGGWAGTTLRRRTAQPRGRRGRCDWGSAPCWMGSA